MYIETKKKSKFTIKEFAMFTSNLLLAYFLSLLPTIIAMIIILNFNDIHHKWYILGLPIMWCIACIYHYLFFILTELRERID